MKFIKAFLKALFYIFSFLILLIIILAVLFIAPVDRTPVEKFPFYSAMMDSVAHLNVVNEKNTDSILAVGFSKENLTPPFPTATAGYGKRMGKSFQGVHDSLYVRTLVVDNGRERVAIVSADLLIIPPTVTAVLKTKLPEIGFSLDNTFLGATHSHNSIGNWGEGAAAVLYGSYEEEVVNFIAEKILISIQNATKNITSSKLKSGFVSIPEAVSNRLIDDGPEDPLLRFIEIERSDSVNLLFMTFNAHATCLYSKDLGLSRDYPGKVVDLMEQRKYDFAMFMAGAVASHACGVPEDGMNCINTMAEIIVDKFFDSDHHLQTLNNAQVSMKRVGLLLGEPQVKIDEDWKIRSSLFNATFGEYPSFLTTLRIGNVTLMGTPCDFSGEFNPFIDSVASTLNTRAIVTSFNGGYVGYVTPRQYYDVDHYETQLMNWYPPGNGEYMRDCLVKMMQELNH